MDENDEPGGSNTESVPTIPPPPPNPFAFIRKLPARPAPRDKNGHLLQHARLQFTKTETKKLTLSMQKLDSDVLSFSDKEDKRIQKNWKKFQTKYELDGHIFEYCGLNGKCEQKPLDPSWFFWPSICDGLPNRTAHTIQKRISRIFDENYDPNPSDKDLERRKLSKISRKRYELKKRLEETEEEPEKVQILEKMAELNTVNPGRYGSQMKLAFKKTFQSNRNKKIKLRRKLGNGDDEQVLEKLAELEKEREELYRKKARAAELLESGESEDAVVEQLNLSKLTSRKFGENYDPNRTHNDLERRKLGNIYRKRYKLKKRLGKAEEEQEKEQILEKIAELDKENEELSLKIRSNRDASQLKLAFKKAFKSIRNKKTELQGKLGKGEDEQVLEKLAELEKEREELYSERSKATELLNSGESEDVIAEQLNLLKKLSAKKVPDPREIIRISMQKTRLNAKLREAVESEKKERILEEMAELNRRNEKLCLTIHPDRDASQLKLAFKKAFKSIRNKKTELRGKLGKGKDEQVLEKLAELEKEREELHRKRSRATELLASGESEDAVVKQLERSQIFGEIYDQNGNNHDFERKCKSIYNKRYEFKRRLEEAEEEQEKEEIHEKIAELNKEKEELCLTIYPDRDGSQLKLAFKRAFQTIRNKKQRLQRELGNGEDEQVLEKLAGLEKERKDVHRKRSRARELLKSGESEDVVIEQLNLLKRTSRKFDDNNDPNANNYDLKRKRQSIYEKRHKLKRCLEEIEEQQEKEQILEEMAELEKEMKELHRKKAGTTELTLGRLLEMTHSRLWKNRQVRREKLSKVEDKTTKEQVEMKLAESEREYKEFFEKRTKAWELKKTGKSVVEIAEQLSIPIPIPRKLVPNKNYDLILNDLMDQLQSVEDDQEEKLKIESKIREIKAEHRRHRNQTESTKRLIPDMYMKILRYLYRCVKTESFAFKEESFDWDKFDAECDRANFEIPNTKSVINTYFLSFKNSHDRVFRYVTPLPTLKERIVIIYESLTRWISENTNQHSRWFTASRNQKNAIRIPILKSQTVFAVLYEQYTNKNKSWKPPTELERFLAEMDVEKVGKHVEKAEEMQKRDAERKRKAREETQSPLTVRTVRLRARSEGPPAKTVKFRDHGREARNREDMEISAIHNTFDANLTAISVADVSASASFRADETILAGGGRKRGKRANSDADNDATGFESLLLPKIEESARKKRKIEEKEKKFSLDESFHNVWDQLIS